MSKFQYIINHNTLFYMLKIYQSKKDDTISHKIFIIAKELKKYCLLKNLISIDTFYREFCVGSVHIVYTDWMIG